MGSMRRWSRQAAKSTQNNGAYSSAVDPSANPAMTAGVSSSPASIL